MRTKTQDTVEEENKTRAEILNVEEMERVRGAAYEFGASIMEKRGGYFTTEAVRLMEICRELHTLDEMRCEAELDNHDKGTMVDLEKEAIELAKEIGFKTAYHQSDPRGCSLYLVSKTDTDYSRGIAVPIW